MFNDMDLSISGNSSSSSENLDHKLDPPSLLVKYQLMLWKDIRIKMKNYKSVFMEIILFILLFVFCIVIPRVILAGKQDSTEVKKVILIID